jgi:hypothetical protein
MAGAEIVYTVSSVANFQMAGADVTVDVRGAKTKIPFDRYQMILEFRLGRTISDAYSSINPKGISEADFRSMILDWVRLGILAGPAAPAVGPSFLDRANPDIFCNPTVVEQITTHLKAGRLVHVPNAMNADFAERAHKMLDVASSWHPKEGHRPFAHYKFHTLVLHGQVPDELKECITVFRSARTREFMEQISGRDCKGDAEFGASWFFPGEYQLPHTDGVEPRSTAYIWNLTKGWNPSWGGSLVWCPTGTSVMPQFNCLTMFHVTEHSLHFVEPVAAIAQSKRLAVHGWWSHSGEAGDNAGFRRRHPTDKPIRDIGYGPPRLAIEGREDITVL